MTAEQGSSLSQGRRRRSSTLPKAREACPHNLAPTTSSLMMLALGDALAIALLEGRGFTSIDFSVLHPGGKLGALLKYTRDLMHSGDAVPLKPLGTKMSDALVEMTLEGFWLRRHRRCAVAISPASSPTAICAAICRART